MKREDYVGKLMVVADYSRTDRHSLLKVITRFMGGSDAWSSGAMSFASMERDEMRAQSKAKKRHKGKKIFVVRIEEVIDVIEE